MRKKPVFVMLVLMAFLFGGCNDNREAIKHDKKTVAVSIVPQKAFVEAVAGEAVDIVVTVPPGSSPENYEPTPKLIEQLSECSIFFSIGIPAESANIIPKLKEYDLDIIKLDEIVSRVYPPREESPGVVDPHIWLSPKRVKVMIDTIAKELSKLVPEKRDIFSDNAEKYKAELDNLDKYIKDSLAKSTSKKIIVYHPAFDYLGEDYGIEIYSLEKDGKEATPQRLMEMIEFAKRENIKAVFYQAEFSPKQAAAFADEIGGQAIMLEPLAEDYINNLKKMADLISKY